MAGVVKLLQSGAVPFVQSARFPAGTFRHDWQLDIARRDPIVKDIERGVEWFPEALTRFPTFQRSDAGFVAMRAAVNASGIRSLSGMDIAPDEQVLPLAGTSFFVWFMALSDTGFAGDPVQVQSWLGQQVGGWYIGLGGGTSNNPNLVLQPASGGVVTAQTGGMTRSVGWQAICVNCAWNGATNHTITVLVNNVAVFTQTGNFANFWPTSDQTLRPFKAAGTSSTRARGYMCNPRVGWEDLLANPTLRAALAAEAALAIPSLNRLHNVLQAIEPIFTTDPQISPTSSIGWSATNGGIFTKSNATGTDTMFGGPNYVTGQSYSVFMAYQRTAVSTGRLLNTNNESSKDWLMGLYNGNPDTFYPNISVNLPGSGADLIWHFGWGIWNNTTSTGQLYTATSAQPTSVAFTATNGAGGGFNQLRMWSRSSGSEVQTANIGFVKVYNGVLDLATVQSLYATYKARFGY